jgi:hypothetical protein
VEHVYHWRRPDLRGTVLYPLNLLASVHPDLYDTEVKKYVGREDLLTFRVPYLDVLWNDVLHTSTVHPSTIRLALEECGFGPEDLRPGFGRFFRIPIEHLEGMPMVWYAADDATGPRRSFRPSTRIGTTSSTPSVPSTWSTCGSAARPARSRCSTGRSRTCW